jgi:hypothetical protein
MDDDNVDATEITVQVHGGEVTLTGTVPGRSKRRAEDLAEDVSGVSEVINNLRLSRHETARPSDPAAAGLSGSGQASTLAGQGATQGGTTMPKGGRGPSNTPA